MPEDPQDPQSLIQGLLSGDPASLREFRPVLDHVITGSILPAIDYEKIIQFNEIRRNDSYWRGDQNTYPYLHGGEFLDWAGVSGSPNQLSPRVMGEDDDDASDDYVVNSYRGDMRKLIAVLGQRAPNVNGEPRIKDNDEQIRRARKAQKVAQLLSDSWDPVILQQRLVHSLAKNGTTFIYTPWVVDGYRYGYTEEPIYEQSQERVGNFSFQCPECALEEESFAPPEICPSCGAEIPPTSVIPPEMATSLNQMGSKRYANGNVEIAIESGLTVTTPYWIRDLIESPWLRYELEADKGVLLRRFPQLRELGGSYGPTGPSGYSTDYGRFTREEIKSFSGTPYYSQPEGWLYTRWWWRPDMYERIDDDERRKELQDQFPDGMKITAVNGFIIQVRPERMDSVWTLCVPEQCETAYPGGYMNDSIQFQEMWDNLINIVHSHAEKSIPWNIIDPSIINPKTIDRMGRTSAEVIFANANTAGKLSNGIYQFDPAPSRPEHVAWAQALQGFNREITGILPSIFGGGEPHQTLGEAEIDRNQALAVLNLLWNNIRAATEGYYRNATMQFGRYSGGKFHLPLTDGAESHETVEVGDVSDLLLGGWKFDAEEQMPMTAGQRRAYVMGLLQQPNMELLDRLGFFHPTKIVQLDEAIFGMTGWDPPQRIERDALLDLIHQLAQSEPTFDQFGMTSSIPPDPYLYDPMLAAETVRIWLLSEEGAQLKETNPIGWQNVFLFGSMNYQMSQPPMLDEEGNPIEEEGGPPGPAAISPGEPPEAAFSEGASSMPSLEEQPPETGPDVAEAVIQ